MVQDLADVPVRSVPILAGPTPLSAIRKRSTKVSNLWIFESPKNDRRLTISGDVPFMHVVLLESDVEVIGYEFVDVRTFVERVCPSRPMISQY